MRNKIAKELSSGKYDQRIVPNKKKEDRSFDVVKDANHACDESDQCTYPYCECVMY